MKARMYTLVMTPISIAATNGSIIRTAKIVLAGLTLMLCNGLNAQVSFTADVSSGCLPLTVNFTNTSTLPPDTYYVWNFGSGPSVSAFDTAYTYTWEGNFPVNLTAYDTTGGMMNFLGSYNL